MKYAACLALALALCAVGPSPAEDKAPSCNYEHLKKLEPLIGAWAGDWVAPQDRPILKMKKGDKLTLTVTYKWDVNKNAILHHSAIGRPESAPVWQSTWLIGWDNANKRIVCCGFESSGGHAVTHDWEVRGDRVTFKGKGSDSFGKKTTFTIVYSVVKKDSCATQMIDLTVDGKKQPDSNKVTLKRVKAR
jgi:hypothetical protein